MTTLDDKINERFPGLVVRKDLVKAVKGNAIVPTYVLEYLLGQYCATNDEASIQSGIETVREILRKHYVHRNEAGLIKSNIREKGRWKIIDRISVILNDKSDAYEASFANLGISKVLIDSSTVKAHPKLLVGGVWCIADIEYDYTEDKNVTPWILGSMKPIQLSQFDYEAYLEARKAFTTDEWIDLLFQTVGFDPEMFGRRSKLIQLMRLIPFVERNYNLIELGPKGTGKSHIFSEFSPHGILVSGGEVTVPKLFVNNSSGKIGLVGYWMWSRLTSLPASRRRWIRRSSTSSRITWRTRPSLEVSSHWALRRLWFSLGTRSTLFPTCSRIPTCLMSCLTNIMILRSSIGCTPTSPAGR
jgi:ATP-dependent Lon protease